MGWNYLTNCHCQLPLNRLNKDFHHEHPDFDANKLFTNCNEKGKYAYYIVYYTINLHMNLQQWSILLHRSVSKKIIPDDNSEKIRFA